jgi:hypothetical protein
VTITAAHHQRRLAPSPSRRPETAGSDDHASTPTAPPPGAVRRSHKAVAPAPAPTETHARACSGHPGMMMTIAAATAEHTMAARLCAAFQASYQRHTREKNSRPRQSKVKMRSQAPGVTQLCQPVPSVRSSAPSYAQAGLSSSYPNTEAGSRAHKNACHLNSGGGGARASHGSFTVAHWSGDSTRIGASMLGSP